MQLQAPSAHLQVCRASGPVSVPPLGCQLHRPYLGNQPILTQQRVNPLVTWPLTHRRRVAAAARRSKKGREPQPGQLSDQELRQLEELLEVLAQETPEGWDSKDGPEGADPAGGSGRGAEASSPPSSCVSASASSSASATSDRSHRQSRGLEADIRHTAGPDQGSAGAAEQLATEADDEEDEEEDAAADDPEDLAELEDVSYIAGEDADEEETRRVLEQMFGSDLPQNDPPGHRSGYVTFLGRPNAGKSTLLNQLLGQKLSIVTAKAQTTRHRILGILSEPDTQMILLDTPGIIETQRNKLDERMMKALNQAVSEADALVAIVDASDNPRAALAMLQPGADWSGPPMALVLNKVDLLPPHAVEQLTAWFRERCRCEVILPISAVTGEGVDAVRAWAQGKLPEGPTLYPKDEVSEHPERFFVAEIIREKIFEQYSQEIPYSVSVQVVDFKERPGAKDYVEVAILTEHERQRPILLGARGSALKQMATAARVDIEKFLGRPVYLDISVKVQEKWRADDKLLERWGY